MGLLGFGLNGHGEVDGGLRLIRQGIVQVKLGIEVCDKQREANMDTIEDLSCKNAGLSAKADGGRELIKMIDSIVPPSHA